MFLQIEFGKRKYHGILIHQRLRFNIKLTPFDFEVNAKKTCQCSHKRRAGIRLLISYILSKIITYYIFRLMHRSFPTYSAKWTSVWLTLERRLAPSLNSTESKYLPNLHFLLFKIFIFSSALFWLPTKGIHFWLPT